MISIEALDLIVYFVYGLIVITLGIYVNRKLYVNVKNEEHLEKGKIIQRIMKTHSIVQCCAWPFLFILAFPLKLITNLNLKIVPPSSFGYMIIGLRFFNSLNGCYGGFNSLIMAISRYVFIIYHEAAESYGIRKLRKLLIGSSIGVPVFLAFLGEALTPVEDVWGSLFLPSHTHSGNQSEGTMQKLPQSPVYLVADECLPSLLKDGLKLTFKVVLILIHLNILEGLIYFHIYINYNRYDMERQIFYSINICEFYYNIFCIKLNNRNIELFRSQNTSFLKTALSDDYRMRRHRRYTISIQNTITSWIVEFITGIIALVNAFFFAHDASLEITTQIFVGIHVFLYFIILPGSYILSTEVYKNLIFENGWGNIFSCRKRRSQVVPSQNDDNEENGLNVNKENNNQDNEASDSIPTISGNVNLETSYKVY